MRVWSGCADRRSASDVPAYPEPASSPRRCRGRSRRSHRGSPTSNPDPPGVSARRADTETDVPHAGTRSSVLEHAGTRAARPGCNSTILTGDAEHKARLGAHRWQRRPQRRPRRRRSSHTGPTRPPTWTCPAREASSSRPCAASGQHPARTHQLDSATAATEAATNAPVPFGTRMNRWQNTANRAERTDRGRKGRELDSTAAFGPRLHGRLQTWRSK